MMRPIFFDLETTGTDPKRDRIVEIAAFDSIRNESFQQLINPGIEIPDEAARIHGITNTMVASAQPFGEVAEQFIAFCSGPVMLVAHNGEMFDLPFLEAEFQRHSVSFSSEWVFVDSLKWARKYRRDLPRHALQYLREFFGFPKNQAHRALDDVETLHRVFSLLTDDLTCEQIIERIGCTKPEIKTHQECALELF